MKKFEFSGLAAMAVAGLLYALSAAAIGVFVGVAAVAARFIWSI